MRVLFRFLRNVYIELTSKKDKSALFFPHENCMFDNYDVFNYRSDNVLVLLNYVLNEEKYRDWSISVVYYNDNRLGDYLNYCKERGLSNVSFVSYNSKRDVFKAFCRSRLVFTDNYYTPKRYKTAGQTVVCLGYYAGPFKDDFFKVARLGFKESLHTAKVVNSGFDYHISTSDLCSRLLSLDSQIFYPKFLSLGFPRNDLFYQQESIKELKQKLYKVIGRVPKHIICYAPTHRDYEEKNNVLRDETLMRVKTLFGCNSAADEDCLMDVLERYDAVLIAKVHPKQEKSAISATKSDRILLYGDIIKKSIFSLQELLCCSDVLITDYSSTFYDFLHLNRPIIFYFYDIDIVNRVRPLFITPIDPFCAGKVVKTIDDLSGYLCDVLEGDDSYSVKRNYVHSLINSCQDGLSSKRIADYFMK